MIGTKIIKAFFTAVMKSFRIYYVEHSVFFIIASYDTYNYTKDNFVDKFWSKMNIQDKTHNNNTVSIPKSLIFEKAFLQGKKDPSLQPLKKGFPLGIKLFWYFIAAVWLVHFFYFSIAELPTLFKVGTSMDKINHYHATRQFHKAFTIHKNLMAQYPHYKKSYYFEIVFCSLMCSKNYEEVCKSLKVLHNKTLSEKQFFELKSIVAPQFKNLFDSFFIVYEHETKNGEKSIDYIFNG